MLKSVFHVQTLLRRSTSHLQKLRRNLHVVLSAKWPLCQQRSKASNSACRIALQSRNTRHSLHGL